MKKIIILTLVVFGIMFVGAFADEGGDIFYGTAEIDMFPEVLPSAESNNVSLFGTDFSKISLNEHIHNALLNRESVFGVIDYKVTLEEFILTYSCVNWDDPYLFYVGQNFSYAYYEDYDGNPNNNIVIACEPRYILTKTQTVAANKTINLAVERTLNGITDDMTDVEKALIVHDNICMEYQYSPDGEETYDIYNMVLNKHGVCQGYMFMYQAAMDKLGIENYFVSSLYMNHIWNMINIDGEYYHIDVTWDDPRPTLTGSALHTNFLVSDKSFTNHTKYTAPYAAESERFAEYYWKSSNTRLHPYKGEFYMLCYHSQGKSIIYKYDVNNNTKKSWKTLRNDEDFLWRAPESRYYTNCYSGFSEYNENVVLYNTRNAVKLLNLDTEEEKTLLTFKEINGEYFYIYGTALTNGELTLMVRNSPKIGAAIYKYTFPVDSFEKVKVSMSIAVEDASAPKHTMVNASYYDGKMLAGAVSNKITFTQYEDNKTVENPEINAVTLPLSGAKKIKTFTWNSLADDAPLYPVIELEIQ
ncbi:MAG: hypothetical protein IJC74_07800 [Clostridia bacterium]|nr:hypothetical protein [Clostridia bacterium]